MGMCYEDDCPVTPLKNAIKILAAHAHDVDPQGCCIKSGIDEECGYKPHPSRDDCIECMSQYVRRKAWDVYWHKISLEECLKSRYD